jgi:hypothetical protein
MKRLKLWLFEMACAVGIRSHCGHWGPEFLDGLCFDCNYKLIEQRTWSRLAAAIRLVDWPAVFAALHIELKLNGESTCEKPS